MTTRISSSPATRSPPGLSSIRGRILLGIGVLIVCLVALVAVMIWLTREYRSVSSEAENRAVTEHLLNDAAREGAGNAAFAQIYATTGERSLLARAQNGLDSALVSLRQAATQMRSDGRPDDAARVDELIGTALDLTTQWTEAAALHEAGDVAGAISAAASSLTMLQTLADDAAGLSVEEQTAVEMLTEEAHSLANATMYTMVVLGSFLIIGIAVALWVGAGSILAPLRRLEATALALGEGDLSARAPVTGPSEIAAVGGAFNRMTEKLLDASRRLDLEEEREAAYAALKEIEDKWRSLVSNTSDIVSILDAQGDIRFMSPSVTPLLGYSSDELIGESGFALIHPDDQPLTTQRFAEITGPGPASGKAEFRCAKKAGGFRTLSAVGSALTDKDGNLTGVIVVSRDITEQREMEEQLRFQAYLLDAVGDAVIATDLDGIILYWNGAAERLYGWAAEETLGRPVQEMLRTTAGQTGPAEAIARVAEGASFSAEYRTSTRSGEWIPVEVAMSPLRDVNGRITGAIGDSHDISERKKAEDTIRHMAYHDALTGLPNRLLLKDRFEMAIAQARRGHGMASVVSLDLDHFKIINDTLGHAAGDELLEAASQRLLATVRDEDTVARLGGDEFMILLVGLASKAEGVAAATRIVDAFRPPFRIAGTDFQATVSVGIAFYADDGADLESITAAADTAMYAAKDAGRDGLHIFTPELRTVARRQTGQASVDEPGAGDATVRPASGRDGGGSRRSSAGGS